MRNLFTKDTPYGKKGHNFKDLTGTQFGMLTVVGFVKTNKNGTSWKLKCKCGNEVVRLASNFKKKHKHSCGCVSKNPGKKNAGFRRLFHDYKSSANLRGHQFKLTMKQFKLLIYNICNYCGAVPTERYKKQVVHTLLANGIDRIDNDKGYTKENSVTCCKICNIAKSSMTKSEFLTWIKRVYENNFKWEPSNV